MDTVNSKEACFQFSDTGRLISIESAPLRILPAPCKYFFRPPLHQQQIIQSFENPARQSLGTQLISISLTTKEFGHFHVS